MTTSLAAAPFRRRTLYALIAIGVTSLVVALVLALFADDFRDDTTSDANGYSTSAVGYQALVRVLRALDIPVTTSRSGSAGRARDGLLVIVAPDVATEEARTRLTTLVESAHDVLLVLPRWWGNPDPDKEDWIERRYQVGTYTVDAVLEALDLDGEVERRAATFAGGPVVPEAQVLVDHDLEEDVVADDGVSLLVGLSRSGTTRLWVLTDPSVIDNAGVRQRANLHFAVNLIERLRHGGPVVFDETVHGFEETPSIWKALRRFPLVLVTIHVALAFVLLLWAAVGRWGPARAAAPPLASGKDFLIRNTAALLHAGGHDADALARYLATTIHGVAQVLHAPRDLDGAALRTWLERVRASRGGAIALPELETEVATIVAARKQRHTSKRIVELAARIHRWRTEMTHGPRNHP